MYHLIRHLFLSSINLSSINLSSIKKSSGIALSALTLGTGMGVVLELHPGRATDLQPVTLNFQAIVGDQPFRCDQNYRLGTVNTLAMPADFRLYVSEVALIDAKGNVVPVTLEQDGKWQYEDVALLDFEDKTGACANGTSEIRTQVVGQVPAGNYQGVQFTVGVPFALNHGDATLAHSPLNLTSLWWNWQGGYKFLRVDLATQPMQAELPAGVKGEGENHGHAAPGATSGHGSSPEHGTEPGHSTAATGFSIHLGSTGCQAASNALQPTQCVNPNRTEIVLMSFDPGQQVIAVDLAALVQSNNLTTNVSNTPPGCMSAPEDGDCMGIFHNLGLPFNGAASAGQTVFRVQ